MATTTAHLGLTKPAGTDPVSVDVLNRNFDAIDAGVLDAKQGRAAYNLLDNSYFPWGQVVAQAGANAYHGTVKYVCDRWFIWDNSVNASFGAGGIIAAAVIQQNIEPAKISAAADYTVAAGMADGTVTMGQCKGNGSADNGVIAYFWNNGKPCVRLAAHNGITWAALYKGAYTADTLPPYIPKGNAAEMAECRRYYRYGAPLHYYPSSDNGVIQGISYGEPMRETPTVTICDEAGNVGYVSGWGQHGTYKVTRCLSNEYGVPYISTEPAATPQVTPAVGYWYEANADL